MKLSKNVREMNIQIPESKTFLKTIQKNKSMRIKMIQILLKNVIKMILHNPMEMALSKVIITKMILEV